MLAFSHALIADSSARTEPDKLSIDFESSDFTISCARSRSERQIRVS
jgi:hypothetical protein